MGVKLKEGRRVSGGEFLVLFLSFLVAVWCWFVWYEDLALISRWHSRHIKRSPLYLTPVLCLGILYLVVSRLAASSVRSDPQFIGFYLILGAAIVGLCTRLFPFLGLDARQDVAERGNSAATLALGGALVGLTLSFCGANVGEGPGFHVVLFCTLLSVGGLMILWLIYELLTSASDAITVDRDLAAGLRFGCLLAAAGLILGFAVTGEWGWYRDAWGDFLRFGWPVGPLTVLAAVLQRLGAAGPERPSPSLLLWGVVPGGGFLVAAILCVWAQGWWLP